MKDFNQRGRDIKPSKVIEEELKAKEEEER